MTTTAAISYRVQPYHPETYTHEVTDMHSWTVTAADGTVISELYVDMTTLEVRNIWTHEDHREQGHATALWTAATEMLPVRHSHAAHRTDDGDRFAARVGGETAPCTDDCDCDAPTDDDYDTED